jgi:hypothetical protein
LPRERNAVIAARASGERNASANIRASFIDFSGIAAQKFAGVSDGVSGLGGEQASLLHGDFGQVFRGDDGVDKAHFTGLFGIEGFAEKQQFGGAGHADPTRQKKRRGGFRHDAQVYERHTEFRARRGVGEVAMEQHRRTDADRRAINRGD